MSEDITDFVELYVQNSDILDEALETIEGDLEKNMRSNLWKGHGYDTGQLYRDIQARSEKHGNYGIVTGFFTVEHGDYVIRGVRGKGLAKAGEIKFLENGLNETVEMYR